jgi:predicted membrane chloride channel (bestrophin family)
MTTHLQITWKLRVCGSYLHSLKCIRDVVLKHRASFAFLALVLAVCAYVNQNVRIPFSSFPFLFQGVEFKLFVSQVQKSVFSRYLSSVTVYGPLPGNGRCIFAYFAVVPSNGSTCHSI